MTTTQTDLDKINKEIDALILIRDRLIHRIKIQEIEEAEEEKNNINCPHCQKRMLKTSIKRHINNQHNTLS